MRLTSGMVLASGQSISGKVTLLTALTAAMAS